MGRNWDSPRTSKRSTQRHRDGNNSGFHKMCSHLTTPLVSCYHRWLRLKWFQYEITMAVVCFEWWEKAILNLCVLSVLSLFAYGFYRQACTIAPVLTRLASRHLHRCGSPRSCCRRGSGSVIEFMTWNINSRTCASHYHDYRTEKGVDRRSAESIYSFREHSFGWVNHFMCEATFVETWSLQGFMRVDLTLPYNWDSRPCLMTVMFMITSCRDNTATRLSRIHHCILSAVRRLRFCCRLPFEFNMNGFGQAPTLWQPDAIVVRLDRLAGSRNAESSSIAY